MHPERLSVIKPYLVNVNLTGIPMPTPICLQTFDKIEKLNPEISINIWEWNESKKTVKCVIHSKNYDCPHIIHLIALSEIAGKVEDFKVKHHFIWVKDIEKLLFKDSAHKAKKHFCNKCTQTFTCKQKLDTHQDWCYKLDNVLQKVTLPKDDGMKNYQKFKYDERMMYVLCVIKADFESKHIIKDENYGGAM